MSGRQYLPLMQQDVVAITTEDDPRAQSLFQKMDEGVVLFGVQVGDTGKALDPVDAFLGDHDRPCLEVDGEVAFLAELGHDACEFSVRVRRFIGGSGNDERRPCFINKNVINFIDNRIVQVALHHLPKVVDHVVAEVVEAELVIGPIGNVGVVGVPA